MNIGVTVRVTRVVTAAVTAVAISAATVDYSVSAQAAVSTDINYSTYIVPIYPVPESQVSVGDGEGFALALVKDLDVFKVEEALPEDSDPIFDVAKVLDDAVTVVESQIKIITNPVDFDRTDDDVDPTPVVVSDSDAKDVSIGELADSDDVVVGESSAKHPEKPGLTATVAMSEAVDDFDVGKSLTDTPLATDAIDQFAVDTQFADSVTITDAPEKEFTLSSRVDDVTMSGDNIKAFNSSVDFDRADDDVDPDPITPTDQINSFDLTKAVADALSATESDEKNLTRPDVSDAVTASEGDSKAVTKPALVDAVSAVEGIVKRPETVYTDAAAVSEAITKFDPRLGKTDSVAASEAVDAFDVELVKLDSVNITDVAVKNFTENVDFDRNDADADADPVSITELLSTETTKPLSEAFALSDAPVFTVYGAYSDSVAAGESIYTQLVLGESSYLWPDIVVASDGDNKFRYRTADEPLRAPDLSYAVGNTFSLLNHSDIFGYGVDAIQHNRTFLQHRRFQRRSRLDDQLAGAGMLLNSSLLWGKAVDSYAYENYTGIIGGPGLLNETMIRSEFVTYPDTSGAGIVVDFHYTDTADRTVGGYYFNETPIL